MRGHPQARDILRLEIDVSIEQIIREHVPGLEELAILIEGGKRLIEGEGHMLQVLFLLGRQIVEVLIERIARMDLVLNAVEAGHEHGRERQVRVGH